MPDWARHVRERLPPLGLAPEREAEIAEELALQLEHTHRAALRAGCSEEQATARAEAEVPDWAALAAAIRAAERPVASRLRPAPAPTAADPRPGGPMTDLALDLRNALRSLARSRSHAAVVVATLALGIGATTTIFSAVHVLLLRPLPFPDAGRLVYMLEAEPRTGGRMSLSWPNYLAPASTSPTSRSHAAPPAGASWRSGWRSAPAGGGSCASSSPRAWSWR